MFDGRTLQICTYTMHIPTHSLVCMLVHPLSNSLTCMHACPPTHSLTCKHAPLHIHSHVCVPTPLIVYSLTYMHMPPLHIHYSAYPLTCIHSRAYMHEFMHTYVPTSSLSSTALTLPNGLEFPCEPNPTLKVKFLFAHMDTHTRAPYMCTFVRIVFACTNPYTLYIIFLTLSSLSLLFFPHSS